MSLGNRLKLVRGQRTQKEFSEALGISKNTYAHYERDERVPDATLVAFICREYSINPAWFLTGEGPMQRGEEKVCSGDISPKFDKIDPLGDDLKWLVKLLDFFNEIEGSQFDNWWRAHMISIFFEVFLKLGRKAALDRVIMFCEGMRMKLNLGAGQSDDLQGRDNG